MKIKKKNIAIQLKCKFFTAANQKVAQLVFSFMALNPLKFNHSVQLLHSLRTTAAAAAVFEHFPSISDAMSLYACECMSSK